MHSAAIRTFTAVAALSATVWAGAPAAHAFGFDDVAQQAKALAAKPYQAPPSIPAFLANLDYDQYQQIRFRPDQSLWRQSHTRFQVMLIAPGEYFRHPIKLNVVDAAGVHPLGFNKSLFAWPDSKLEASIPGNLGYAGFKLTFPINRPDVQDQFLVFAGASYFRGVARGENFGLSARGIAIDTGLPGGEEFPVFTEFWLVRPSPSARVMQFYALLDGKSLTGAYRFVVFPGKPTRIEVRARLFLRKPVDLLGLAPLTSMFFYGANTPRPADQWRPAVHDSQGLLIHSGTGEWLWRPLINPLTLQMDYFASDSPQGFGLMQRTTRFTAYEDDEARYDNRPSAWVEPHADWGKGHVVLVEIPTDSETNDNIVAFWSPDAKTSKGQKLDLDYTLDFGGPDIPGEPMARAVSTYVGKLDKPPQGSNAQDAYRLIVDFAGGPLSRIAASRRIEAVVTGIDGTRVIDRNVRWVKPTNRWRLSVVAAPAAGKDLALRAFLKSGKETLSETWTYALPAKNRLGGG
jgi:periplasmic glucans biosynthesis protein